MRKVVLILILLISVIVVYGNEKSVDYKIINEGVISDYGLFLKPDEKINLHKKIEYLYNQTGILLKIVTLKDDSTIRYVLNNSITDYFEKNKNKYPSVLVLLRTESSYKIYYYGKLNNDVFTKEFEAFFLMFKENQEAFELKTYNEEFDSLINTFLQEDSYFKLFKKFGAKEGKSFPYLFQTIISGIVLIFIIITIFIKKLAKGLKEKNRGKAINKNDESINRKPRLIR